MLLVHIIHVPCNFLFLLTITSFDILDNFSFSTIEYCNCVLRFEIELEHQVNDQKQIIQYLYFKLVISLSAKESTL